MKETAYLLPAALIARSNAGALLATPGPWRLRLRHPECGSSLPLDFAQLAARLPAPLFRSGTL